MYQKQMTKYTKFQEHIWLVNTIRKAKKITFAVINKCWLETNMNEVIPMDCHIQPPKNANNNIFGIYTSYNIQNRLHISS